MREPFLATRFFRHFKKNQKNHKIVQIFIAGKTYFNKYLDGENI
jgi:hypothetical protein